MVFVGIGLAAPYWFIESLLHVFAFNQNFMQRLFHPDLTGLYRRRLVLSIFLLFGSHAQSAFKKQEETDQDLREYSKRLEELVRKNL